MAAGVLQDVTLSYQVLWNAQRQVAGVKLNLEVLPGRQIEAGHLLTALQSAWHAKAPALLLSTADAPLLAALLRLDLKPTMQLVVSAELLNDSTFARLVTSAKQRGLQLVWQGQPGQTPLPRQTTNFAQQIVNLSPEQALMALRVSRHSRRGGGPPPPAHLNSPVQANQMVENLPSLVLARHCLDEQHASAVISWPVDDVLNTYQHARIQPSLTTVRAVLKAIETDISIDVLEPLLAQDPVLAYRFLRYVNSAGLGFDRAIDSLRQGLMVLGLSRTASWLRELAPQASQDVDLEPLRQGLALRSRFMALLLDAGESDALRRELALCGLLSHIDWLLGESMASALRGLPMHARITEALLSKEGPYWPFLAIASALENPYPTGPQELCAQYSFDLEEVNLVLLHTLAALK
jgi:hypothetical protein